MNALDLFNSTARPTLISLGCPLLDRTVGGLPAQGITEICGEAGCGKTQLCLTLALQVQLDIEHGGRSGSAAYLSCGEGTFPIRRLSQVAMSYEAKTGISNQQFLSNVHIEHCYNTDDAQSILRHKIPELCQKQNVKLLIIDSLAGLVRFEYDNRSAQEMKARTILLFSLARELKLLADIFKLAIVVVNQVKADFIDSKFGEGNACSIPALGMAWSYCVNTRISLHRNSSAVRAISMIHDRGDINGDGDGSGGEDEGAAAGVGAAARDAKDGYPTVKVEQEASVGSKRSYGHVSATGVSHPYSRPFDDSFYADLSGYCDDAPSSGSRISKSNAVCTAIMVHSSADKENSSANSVPAAEKAGVKPELSASYAGLPRAIQYYRHGGSGGGGSASGAGVRGGVSGARSTRSMRLEFSPCKGSAECAYEITSTGIMGIF